MKLLIFLPFLGLVFLFCGITPAESAQDCLQHTVETCKNNNVWSDGGFCNAIYGNYQGNKQNLQKLMLDHFKQSFQFIVTVIKMQYIRVSTHLKFNLNLL